MNTLKIKKEITSFETVEIPLPAFYKISNKYFKITGEKEMDQFTVSKSYLHQFNGCMDTEIKPVIETGTPISEQEFKDALNSYRENVEAFLEKQLARKVKLLVPYPEMAE